MMSVPQGCCEGRYRRLLALGYQAWALGRQADRAIGTSLSVSQTIRGLQAHGQAARGQGRADRAGWGSVRKLLGRVDAMLGPQSVLRSPNQLFGVVSLIVGQPTTK